MPAIGQAQSWSWDARKIGMGGSSGNGNLANKMIDDQRDYRSIVLPLGLSQILSNTKRFDPNSKNFDPIMAIEYAATPWHYVIGRDSSNNPGETAFVNDVRNGTLSRDLTKYRGFVPANSFLAEGLVAPSFGHTFKVHKNGPNFQGFYLGAGPYLSMRSQSAISTRLTTVLSTGVNQANATFPLSETDQAQLALAVIGGYRARFALPARWTGGSDRGGLYVAANYNYLRGFGYNHDDLAVELLTDNGGRIKDASNVLIDNRHAKKGTGLATDIGVGAVVRRSCEQSQPSGPRDRQWQLRQVRDCCSSGCASHTARGLPGQRRIQRQPLVGSRRNRTRIRWWLVPRRHGMARE
ncbi:MAG: hypothetical protein AUH28_15425 [Acidobacteria bacterium 13_1_40CM_56_16]|nr:MAG: hypothetical protein AUH28_15425 [Acidobacteria bacterium 13_1_40CM_56_16]